MKDVRIFIERASDGTYSAYMPDDDGLDYGVCGTGSSADEAIADIKAAYQGMKEHYETNEKYFEEINMIFSYDVSSFLAYYSSKLSLSGLEKITGVAQGQLSHYVTGRRNPSPKTRMKIETALHNFAKDLSQVHLV
ncbi:MAG: type II toxin-antitoxin system HicB family antitoxin [Muribaculaceae bacterium]|nr:type II toxin-antitoxin system HicB family antitoxin [Muribaculaceae bacterium]